MNDINIKQINSMISAGLARLKVYATFIFMISILLIYAFLIVRISVLTQAEPSETAVTEQTNTIKRLKLDQNSIDKIQQLEDQNIGVQSLFEAARENPFQD